MSLTRSKRAPSAARFLIHVTAEERDLLLSHVEPAGALDHLLSPRGSSGPLVTLELSAVELDELMQLVEQTANCAQNVAVGERLGQTYTRLESGLNGNVDPGAHLVRPAAARSGYSAKQGQYLAFVLYYLKLHGRPPAEAEFQAYFKVSPPAVHEMLKTLQRRGFIARRAGVARSIRLLLRPEQIPDLE